MQRSPLHSSRPRKTSQTLPTSAFVVALVLLQGIVAAQSGRRSAGVATAAPNMAIGLPNPGVQQPPVLDVWPSSVNFGDVAVGATLTQTGHLIATGGPVTITAPPRASGPFSVMGVFFPITLQPGESTAFTLVFHPQTAGAFAEDISFVSSAANSPVIESVTGTGTSQSQPGQLTVSPASVNFGSVTVGSSQTQNGTLSASGGSVTIASAPATTAPFSLNGIAFPLTLAAGQSASFVLTFKPKTSGSVSENISFASNAGNSPSVQSASGTGTSQVQPSQLTLSPSSINFGNVRVGSVNSQNVTLAASGASVTISSAPSITSPFSFSGISFPITLAAGQSASFQLTFKPSAQGASSENISFASNASNSPSTETVSGTAGAQQNAPIAHGMFVLNPPGSDRQCSGSYPPGCFSRHLVPTFICSGSGTPAGYNCTQAGAGEKYIKGAVFQVRWSDINSSNGTYDYASSDNRMIPWADAGKLVSFIFEPTSFGNNNSGTPSWYLTPARISSVSQSNGIIELATSAPMGFFPGGTSAAAGLEVQIKGTGTGLDGDNTAAKPGIWLVCDHNTSGCQDPTAQKIYAIGSGADIATVVGMGTVGNPVYGNSCSSGMLPIQWRPNFIKAWEDFIAQTVGHYETNGSVEYMRFGMGIGGQTNPTQGISGMDPRQSACQAEMTKFGFTSVAAPWPDPGSSGWSEVSANWISYLNTMLQFEQSLHSSKAIVITLSPIIYGPDDLATANATAANAAAAGIGMGNQGLQKSDPINHGDGRPCFGGDWCANLSKFHGQVSTELQTLAVSDPTDTSQMGSLAPSLLTFATGQGAGILELYFDDWMCTYDSSWNGHNPFAACNAAGYPAAVSAAAKKIN